MNFVTGFCALMMMSTLYMRRQTLNTVDIMLIMSVYVNEPLLKPVRRMAEHVCVKIWTCLSTMARKQCAGLKNNNTSKSVLLSLMVVEF